MVVPLSTIKKFHVEIVFVVWLRDLSWEVKIVFFSLSFCHLICLFFDCKYNLHLPLFSLIVMAIPACTCEQVHIQHSFEFLCVVSGISVGLAQKISARCNTSFYFFSFFFICIFILLLAISHMYFFLFPQCVPSDSEVGYEKSIMTRTETFSITICFKEPLLFIILFLKRTCFYLPFTSISTWN